MDPAVSPESAWLSLARAYEHGNARLAAFLRRFELTPAQYNILRILRGAGPSGLACSAIAQRMIHRDPDITRLSDRLEKRGLVVRRRDPDDRRTVLVALAPAGSALTDSIDEPLARFLEDMMKPLSAEDRTSLRTLLDRYRSAE